ncbi:hypothetical protein HYPSUDRAFT_724975 [Hypholoma sublateritium FD-334 SS-4]|uniref:DUF6534 domain-containing protein n=1 Tax=Hypholoma sublateritium (strain FD-334 SS-4) TaxID=945553 RepID=A0A0D2NYJ7_HYPSF|nr:hypothetical protein HYPSUDRAFT_724975 [Hypholoma sublateritium FD-334 SS-4]
MDQPAPPLLSQLIPDFTSITGPPLLGIVLNWALFGILSTQLFIYYQAFPRDKSFLKALVYSVYLLEAVQTILLMENAWRVYASGFGNLEVFDEVETSWLSVGILGGLVACMVQSFYAYRIYVLSQSRIITGIIVFMALASYSGSLATSIVLQRARNFSELFQQESRIFALFGLWQSAGTVCDVLIAACMTFYLKKMSQGGLAQTQRVVAKLLRLTVETGIVTATISIISLAVYYSFTQFQYYEVPLSAIAKLYSNTMLVAVNSRVRFRVMSESTTWKDVAVLSLHFQSSDETEVPQSTRQQETIVFAERRNGSMETQRRKTQDMVHIDAERV